MRRRKQLVDELRMFLEVAMGANREHLTKLEHLRLLAHARAFLARVSIDEAKSLHGIGPQTLAALKHEGFVSLFDVLSRNILLIRGIGLMRAAQVRAYARQRLDQILKVVESLGPTDPLPFPRDPKVDEEYDGHREFVLQRQTQLGVDVGTLVAHEVEIGTLMEAAHSRTTADRFRKFKADLVATLRSPARWVGHAGGMAAGLVLLGAVPLAAGAWSSDAHIAGAMVSAAVVWLALHAGVVSWFVLADKAYAVATRPLNPHNFVEQRLQLQVLHLAHEVGIAPPRVVLDPNPRELAYTVGRAQGPSVIVIGELLLQTLEQESLVAVIGHEMGHLHEDHIRQRVAIDTVLWPIRWLHKRAFALAFHIGVRVGHTLHDVDDGRLAVRNIRVASALWTLALLPFGAVALVLSCLTLALSGITGLFSRLHEFQADRIGKRLSGGGDAMERALTHIEQIVALLTQVDSQPVRVARMPGEAAHAVAPPLPVRAQHLYSRTEARLSMTHPLSEARMEALEGDIPLVRDTVRAAMAVALVAVVGATTLWYGVAGARTLAHRLAQVEMPSFRPQATPATAVAPAPQLPSRAAESLGLVRFKVRRCHLRAEGNKYSKSVTVKRQGDSCEQRGAEANDWVPVRCDGDLGWVHRSCLVSHY